MLMPAAQDRAPLPRWLYRSMQLLYVIVLLILVWDVATGTTVFRVGVLIAALALGLRSLRKFRPSQG